MFLSFIVPVYNVEKYLGECLDSLLNQDITHEEYEIICVNDGSTDNSGTILKRYQEKYSNITVISQQNSGVAVARNVGLDHARGDYIWFVDSDDIIACNILRNMKSIAENQNPDIIDFGAYSFREQLTSEEKTAYMQSELPAENFANHVYITRSLFRTDFLIVNHVQFDEGIAYSEDSLFKCKCLVNNPHICHINRAYYLVRYQGRSATALTTPDAIRKKLISYHAAALKFQKYYLEADGELKAKISDLLMSNLWFEMYTLSGMPTREADSYLKRLREERLFPFIRPKECTLRKSYMTRRTDSVGKLFDIIYINQHRPWGYFSMRLLRFLICLKQGIRRKQ